MAGRLRVRRRECRGSGRLRRFTLAAAVGAAAIVVTPTPTPTSAASPIAPLQRRCFAVDGTAGDLAVVNLTPVRATARGNGQLVSSDVTDPPTASNVNFRPGSVDPNVAFAPIGADSEVCFVNSEQSTVDLVADHLGTIDASAYTPASADGAPVRALDTRSGRAIAPLQRRCFAVDGTAGDLAVVNLTPVRATARGNGQLVSSDVTDPPTASNVNFRPGSVDPNVAFAPIGADSEVCFVNSEQSTVDLVADHLGTIDASAYTPASADGAPVRVLDTRDDVLPGGPVVLIDPPREPSPAGCAASTLASHRRISIDPRINDFLAGVDWSTVDGLMLRRLIATVMAYSGPFPSAVGRTAEYDDWVQRVMPRPGEVFDIAELWSAMFISYHETVHGFQRGSCAMSATGMGYPTPRIGPDQSAIHADVRSRVAALIPDVDDFCRFVGLSVADTYLTGSIAAQGLESQLWEINAYVLDLEFGRKLWDATGPDLWGRDLRNLAVESAKLHQLARYVQHARGVPGLWEQMRALGVHKTVADHWNLAASLWTPYESYPDSRGCWDLAFGPDSRVIAEFTGGLAGTMAPPRPPAPDFTSRVEAFPSSASDRDLVLERLQLDLLADGP